MKIEKDRVVRFHYAVAEVGQASVENSKEGGHPLAILYGHGNIIPGLEKVMDGREAGESFKTTVPAVDAYGRRRDGPVERERGFQYAIAPPLGPAGPALREYPHGTTCPPTRTG